MVSRPAPKPMSKWAKGACMGVAILLVLALGIAVTDWTRGGDEDESSIQTDASMTEEGSSSDGNDADGSWRGLETAGIPKPGAWSRQRMSLATIRDGKIDYDEGWQD